MNGADDHLNPDPDAVAPGGAPLPEMPEMPGTTAPGGLSPTPPAPSPQAAAGPPPPGFMPPPSAAGPPPPPMPPPPQAYSGRPGYPPPGYPPQGYPPPGYPPPGYPPPGMPYTPVPMIKQGNNGMAIASMILGIAGLLCFPFVTSILAIVFGFIAVNQIKDSGGLQEGQGMAVAGIVTGFVGIVAWVIIFIIAAFTDSNDPYYYDSLFTMMKMSVPLMPLLPFL